MKVFTSQSWHGHLNLNYSYNQQQKKTEVNSVYSIAPLKVQSPFYPEGKRKCHSLILHTAGGIVGGDLLSQKIHLQPETQVLISTPSATKIYGSKEKTSKQDIKIMIEKDACLEYLPQETIIFNNGRFTQKIQIKLGLNATYLGWEIIRFGRSARDEIFKQGELINITEIWQNNLPLWIDRQKIIGSENLFYSQNALGGKPVYATLTYVGKNTNNDLIQEIRQLGHKHNENNNIDIGVTQLIKGLLCRYRGNSISEVKKWFTDISQLLRLFY